LVPSSNTSCTSTTGKLSFPPSSFSIHFAVSFLTIFSSLDIFSIHCVGGIVGNLLTGLFAANYIAKLDGVTDIAGGWLNRHWIQLAHQLADSAAGLVYSFCGSCLILLALNFIPGMHLRVSEEDEVMGIDDTEIGEFAVSIYDVPLPLSHEPNCRY
jgi:ammonium transporter, Amt family